MRYDIDADIYEGPLSLLVELSRLNLVDIFLVKLQELTQSYRELLKTSDRSLNELAEPLPLFGQLVAIKARGLLPQPPQPGDEEEVPVSLEELERRLKEYEQFKTVAQLLAELHALQHQHFGRDRAQALGEGAAAASAQGPLDVGITDLMSAFAKVLAKASAPVYEVKAEPWTVEMKIQELRVILAVKRQVRFLDLFAGQQTKLEVVVTFLALLELMRQRVARAIQERPFADILIAHVEASPA
ncbi:MAG: segregation/condensation protein A [Candidatus Omnitrophica bacterium]|nr:segregation/condensation protein A [Candidatus Omnitrophota bacterium]